MANRTYKLKIGLIFYNKQHAQLSTTSLCPLSTRCGLFSCNDFIEYDCQMIKWKFYFSFLEFPFRFSSYSIHETQAFEYVGCKLMNIILAAV